MDVNSLISAANYLESGQGSKRDKDIPWVGTVGKGIPHSPLPLDFLV